MQRHNTSTQYTMTQDSYPTYFRLKFFFSIFTPIHPNFNFKHSTSPTFNTRNTVTINTDPLPPHIPGILAQNSFSISTSVLFLFPPFLFFPRFRWNFPLHRFPSIRVSRFLRGSFRPSPPKLLRNFHFHGPWTSITVHQDAPPSLCSRVWISISITFRHLSSGCNPLLLLLLLSPSLQRWKLTRRAFRIPSLCSVPLLLPQFRVVDAGISIPWRGTGRKHINVDDVITRDFWNGSPCTADLRSVCFFPR